MTDDVTEEDLKLLERLEQSIASKLAAQSSVERRMTTRLEEAKWLIVGFVFCAASNVATAIAYDFRGWVTGSAMLILSLLSFGRMVFMQRELVAEMGKVEAKSDD